MTRGFTGSVCVLDAVPEQLRSTNNTYPPATTTVLPRLSLRSWEAKVVTDVEIRRIARPSPLLQIFYSSQYIFSTITKTCRRRYRVGNPCSRGKLNHLHNLTEWDQTQCWYLECVWMHKEVFLFLAEASGGGQDQSMPCAHLNGSRGATVGQNISQGQLLLDVYNCMLPVHLRRLLHHNQSDTNTTRFDTSNPDHLGPLFATNATTESLALQTGSRGRRGLFTKAKKRKEKSKKRELERLI